MLSALLVAAWQETALLTSEVSWARGVLPPAHLMLNPSASCEKTSIPALDVPRDGAGLELWPPLSERVQFCVYAAERKTNKRCEMTESCEVPGEGEAGAGRSPYLPSLPTRCPKPSPGHNHCDSALAKMHRLVEVTVSAYFDINVNVSPTVSQPVCVCVCAQPSPALSRSLLEVSTGPGRCCQTSQCGSSPALGVVLSQILAPRLTPAFPNPFGAGFVCFSSSPRADLGAAPKPVSAVLQVKGTGLFWPSTGHRLVFNS